MSDMWCMRGVSEEARRMAKGAAGASGMSLGKWLEASIRFAAKQTKIWGQPPSAEERPYEPLARENNPMLTKDTKFEPVPEKMAMDKTPEPIRECPHGNTEGHYCTKCGKVV